MNGIVHNCTHPSDNDLDAGKVSEKDMVLNIMFYIDRIVQIARPQSFAPESEGRLA